MERRFNGIGLNDLRYLAYSLADKNNIPHPFNKQREMAGKGWVGHHNIAQENQRQHQLQEQKVLIKLVVTPLLTF